MPTHLGICDKRGATWLQGFFEECESCKNPTPTWQLSTKVRKSRSSRTSSHSAKNAWAALRKQGDPNSRRSRTWIVWNGWSAVPRKLPPGRRSWRRPDIDREVDGGIDPETIGVRPRQASARRRRGLGGLLRDALAPLQFAL